MPRCRRAVAYPNPNPNPSPNPNQVLVAQNEALAQTGLLETAEQGFAVLGAPVFLGAILYLLKAGGG